HLGQDLVGHLDEVEVQVVDADRGVDPGGVAGHVLQLGDGLGAGEPAADEDEVERLGAHLRVVGGVGDVQLLQNVVAQEGRLFDGLDADAPLGQAGDGEGAGDRAGGQHDVVVG